jgi:hypothetical protein
VPVVPAPKKAADLILSDVKVIIYTADGKQAAIREGSNFLQHDTLSTGQSVEVRHLAVTAEGCVSVVWAKQGVWAHARAAVATAHDVQQPDHGLDWLC